MGNFREAGQEAQVGVPSQKKYMLKVTYLHSLGNGTFGPLCYFDTQSLLHSIACRGEVAGIIIEEAPLTNG